MQSSYPVMEHFYSVQGEGFHQGKAAYFIRLAGCDVGCVWCDVKESWDMNAYKKLSVDFLIEEILKTKAKIVIITGGEPLLHDLKDLTMALKNYPLQIHLETSGSSPSSGTWDWICLSPKKFKPPLSEIYTKANELKVVIFNQSDFKWAEEQAKKVNKNCKLYLQPEWDNREKIMPLIINYIQQNPQWQIGLQIHKYLQVR